MKPNSLKFKLTAIAILLILAVGGIFLYQNATKENRPPVLSMDSSSFEGSMTNLKGFYEYTAEDVTDAKIAEFTAKSGASITLSKGIHYYYSTSEISIEEIIKNIKPVLRNQILIAYYDTGTNKFKVYPQGPFSNSDMTVISNTAISTTKIPKYRGFIIISKKESEIKNIRSEKQIMDSSASDDVYGLKTISQGWALVPASQNPNDYTYINASRSNGRIQQIWIQTADNTFTKYIPDRPSMTVNTITNNQYSMMWIQFNPPVAPSVCGNGRVDNDETCDGSNLDGATCTNMLFPEGFTGGTLSCNPDCKSFNKSLCKAHFCGDGTADTGENCDGLDLRGATCASGFTGTLVCNPDCMAFTSHCVSQGSQELIILGHAETYTRQSLPATRQVFLPGPRNTTVDYDTSSDGSLIYIRWDEPDTSNLSAGWQLTGYSAKYFGTNQESGTELFVAPGNMFTYISTAYLSSSAYPLTVKLKAEYTKTGTTEKQYSPEISQVVQAPARSAPRDLNIEMVPSNKYSETAKQYHITWVGPLGSYILEYLETSQEWINVNELSDNAVVRNQPTIEKHQYKYYIPYSKLNQSHTYKFRIQAVYTDGSKSEFIEKEGPCNDLWSDWISQPYGYCGGY